MCSHYKKIGGMKMSRWFEIMVEKVYGNRMDKIILMRGMRFIE